MSMKSISLPTIKTKILSTCLIPFIALALLTALSFKAQAEPITLFLNTQPQALELTLHPKSVAHYADSGSIQGGEHFDVSVAGFADSAGRVALIDGQWHGMLLHAGEMYLLNDLSPTPLEPNAENPAPTVKALNQDFSLGQCGVSPTKNFSAINHSSSESTISVASLLTKASTVDFDQFCLDKVDDVCLAAELTVVFDTQFQNQFGSNYPSFAVSILEQVDLLYRQNFNIVFNRIHLCFGDGNNLTSSTDIEAVLEDISTKRLNGQSASYDPNHRSIFHFITGRNYSAANDGTIGLAYISDYSPYPNNPNPVLCSQYAAGTSQVFGAGATKTSYTALIVAHEIGHNFGFDHDGETGSYAVSCSSNQFVMSPAITPGVSQFSTCSHDALEPNINALNPIELCFDFPVESSISAGANSTTQSTIAPFINTYNVADESHPFLSVSVRVKGSISSGDAQFSNVTLAGSNCALSNGNQAYTCTQATAGTGATLQVSVTPNNDDVAMQHSVSLIGSNDAFELNSDDNTVNDQMRFSGPFISPGTLTASVSQTSVTLNWVDRSTNEVSFFVELREAGGDWQLLVENLPPSTQSHTINDLDQLAEYHFRVTAVYPDDSTSTTNEVSINTATERVTRVPTSSSGGSGGGSMGWVLLIALMGLRLIRRSRL